MKFAKFAFWLAGIWGLVIIPPLYFMFDLIGRKDPPPITHPSFYYRLRRDGFRLANCVLLYRHRSTALSPINDSVHH